MAIFALIVPSWTKPQSPQQSQPHTQPQTYSQQSQRQGENATPVSIVSQTEVVGADGSFNYRYLNRNKGAIIVIPLACLATKPAMGLKLNKGDM